MLPHVSNPAPLAEGRGPVVPPDFIEELRSLTVMLRLGGDSEPPRIIMVTSALPREVKSTVNLALVYAESGKRVLVIDGDLRRPSMERMFGITADRGLAQILRAEASLSEAVVVAVPAPEDAEGSTNGHGPTTLSQSLVPLHANGGYPGRAGSVDVVAHGERLQNPLALIVVRPHGGAVGGVEGLRHRSAGYATGTRRRRQRAADGGRRQLLVVVRLGETTQRSASTSSSSAFRSSRSPV